MPVTVNANLPSSASSPIFAVVVAAADFGLSLELVFVGLEPPPAALAMIPITINAPMTLSILCLANQLPVLSFLLMVTAPPEAILVGLEAAPRYKNGQPR